MTVMIRGNNVRIAGQTQNVGVCIGQNVQNSWDSISPMKAATGFNMGDFSAVTSGLSYYFGVSYDWQSIQDADVKGNLDTRSMR